MLKEFSLSQSFHPKLNQNRRSNNKFTLVYNNSIFRYEIESNKDKDNERERLLQQKINFVNCSNFKNSLTYFNEDMSQIPSKTHQIEQESFEMTRKACNYIEVNVERKHKDSYSSIDFRINENIKIQDKVLGRSFRMRVPGKLPYNPDTFDVFQISNLKTNEVYAIPMRIIKNNIIESFFSEQFLLKNTIFFNEQLKNDYKQFKYNLNNNSDIKLYFQACENASKIPLLSDVNFYKNIIEKNKNLFGSKKKIKANTNTNN